MPDLSLVFQVVAAAVPAIIGFLTARMIKGVDSAVSDVRADVKALSTTDTEIKVHLARIDVRLAEVEAKLKGFEFTTPRRSPRGKR